MTSQYEADLRAAQQRREPVDRAAVVRQPYTGAASAYGIGALNRELARLLAAPEGTRNTQLNESGFSLAQLVASNDLVFEDTWSTLYSAAIGIGLTDGEVRATLASSLTAGQQFPRVVPELAALPDLPVLPVIDGDEATDDDPGKVRQQYPTLKWVSLFAEEPKEEFIVTPLVPARRLVALFSPPKMGKSLLLLELAQCVARGAPFLGRPTARADASGLDCGRHVLYVDHENDPHGDIVPRLKAMNVQPETLDKLHYLSFPSMPFLDTPMGGMVLLQVAKFYQAELVVIDTISRTVSGEENDNDTWLNFYRHTGKHLKAEGIACVRLDHTGKDQSKGMRGGSAKYGDVDAVWSLTMPRAGAFKLECTANRLPINPKELHIVRDEFPQLRHRDDPQAVNIIKDETARRGAELLRLAGFPLKGTGDQADGYRSARRVLGDGWTEPDVKAAHALYNRPVEPQAAAPWSVDDD